MTSLYDLQQTLRLITFQYPIRRIGWEYRSVVGRVLSTMEL